MPLQVKVETLKFEGSTPIDTSRTVTIWRFPQRQTIVDISDASRALVNTLNLEVSQAGDKKIVAVLPLKTAFGEEKNGYSFLERVTTRNSRRQKVLLFPDFANYVPQLSFASFRRSLVS